MNTQQLIHLAKTLQLISVELLEVSMTTTDKQAGIKVGEANIKLCEIGKVLCDQIVEQGDGL